MKNEEKLKKTIGKQILFRHGYYKTLRTLYVRVCIMLHVYYGISMDVGATLTELIHLIK